MPFSDEFRNALKQGLAEFEYKNKRYSTQLKGQDKLRQLQPDSRLLQEAKIDPSLANIQNYNTGLTPNELNEFQTWGIQNRGNKENLLREMGSYDIQGAWKDIKNKKIDFDPETGHLPDTYKKPNHITFSNESRYANGQGGEWIQTPNGWQFTPSEQTLSQYGKEKLKNYFLNYEPNSILNVD